MSTNPSKSTSVGAVTTAGSSLAALAVVFSGHPISALFPALCASKPIRESISRLIFGVTEIPETWLRNKKLHIEAQSLPERRVLEKFAEKAGEAVLTESSLAERAQDYALSIAEKKQFSREKIAIRTLERLSEEDIPSDASTPSEDFMRSFESIAEKTSSDELQDMMSRILAGEIRHPGSISRATLAISDILDKEIIDSMLFIKPYLSSDNLVYIEKDEIGKFFPHQSLLSSVRIAGPVDTYSYEFSPDGVAVHSYSGGDIQIKTNEKGKFINLKFPLCINAFSLTKSGRELISLLPKIDNCVIENIAKSHMKNENIEEVQIGKIIDIGGKRIFRKNIQ